MQRISGEDYAKFQKNFPAAASFLRAAALDYEEKILTETPKRNTWQENRLKELQSIRRLSA